MNANRYDYFAIATVQRLLQGLAIGWFFLLVPNLSVPLGDLSFLVGELSVATVVCGLGIGTAVDRRVRAVFGSRAASILNLLVLATGLVSLQVLPDDGIAVFGAFLVGLAVGSDWSSTAELARQSLSNRRRWYGMQLWTVAFAAGIAILILAGPRSTVAFISPAIALSLVAFCVLLPKLQLYDAEASPPSVKAQSLATPEAATEPPVVENNSDTDCDATECCGGAAKAFVSPGFWHGVLLSAVGFATLFGPVSLLLNKMDSLTSHSARLAVASGLIFGFLLMLSASPRVGYAVALLPFLAVGVIVAVLIGPFRLSAAGNVVLLFLNAALAGGVVCGMSALSGELFPDCATDPQRTRVITVSLFGTAIFLLARAMAGLAVGSLTMLSIIDGGVFVVGILAIRAIPAPVISSLGTAGKSDDDDEELNDIIASLNA